MWHIRPTDLIHRRLQSSGGVGRTDSIGETVLTIGAMPLILAGLIAGALGAGALGAAVSPWLAFPAGLIGLAVGGGLAIGLVGNSTVLCGLVEAASYAGLTLMLKLEPKTDPTPAWISAGVVAALFLWATYSAWKRRRE